MRHEQPAAGDGPADFDQRVLAFLAAHGRPRAAPAWGEGPDAVVGPALQAGGREDAAALAAARAFQAARFDAGLAWLTGPTTLGGAGLEPRHVARFRELAARWELPATDVFMIGQQIVAPAIAAFGSPDQQQRWLRALWRGDAIGCQLFSEPDAGSDLASLRCRAEPAEGGWLISGEKVWSSGAHLADLGELLARTDPDPSQRHRGLTMFLLDLTAPGVSVRPLRQMNGNAHFNQVHLDQVFVPDGDRLGPVGQGWAVANASLSSERDLSHDDSGLFLDPAGRLVDLVHHQGLAADPVTRQRVAAAVGRDRLNRWTVERLGATGSPAAASLQKLAGAQAIWDLAQDAAAVVGPELTADTGRWGRYAWTGLVLGAHSQRIAGGTDEIQRNLIGERGLGLPREPRHDHDHRPAVPGRPDNPAGPGATGGRSR